MNKGEAKEYVQERCKEYDLSVLSVKQKVALINQLIKELRHNNFVVIIDDIVGYPVQGVSVDDFGLTYLV